MRFDYDLVYYDNMPWFPHPRARRLYPDYKVVDIADLNPKVFYIDQDGFKHIGNYTQSWQPLKCKWDDIIYYDREAGVWKVAKTPAEKLKGVKHQKILELQRYTNWFITRYYPLDKQNSDMFDLQFYIQQLVQAGVNLTTIYEVLTEATNQYWNKGIPKEQVMKTVLNKLLPLIGGKTPEILTTAGVAQSKKEKITDDYFKIAIEQITKASIRLSWVIQIKVQFHQIKQEINSQKGYKQLLQLKVGGRYKQPPPDLF